ncbi:MAG: hypothetical protein QOC71_102 [Thermoplasmata archaeon]|jgi:hypothetical protein|nr:hypothetical protein [Thermoplasmata archaeon]
MAGNLAPVYLDDARVTLQGDPRPQVAKILQAGGQQAGEGLVILRLREAAGADGQPVALTEVIDREKAIAPVYLRVVKQTPSAGDLGDFAPGDISRGTEAVSPTPSGKRPGFAESQSFADPAHRGGSPQVAPNARPRATKTTELGNLERASEEE